VALDLEDAVSRSELIVAVRLKEITEARIVHGGKQEVVTQQYKFDPVRVLKGVYARDALLLTDADLGIYRFAEGEDRIEPEQMLLLLLGRTGPGYFNCNSNVPTLAQSIPRLVGRDDPLLTTVRTLIAMAQQRDRARKTSLAVEGLREVEGRAAVPLLLSLRRRPLLAAQTPRVLEASKRSLADQSPVVREAAARTLQAVQDADYLEQRELRAGAGETLATALESGGPALEARIAALDALGSVGPLARQQPQLRALLRVEGPAGTLAERAALLRAVGRVGIEEQRAAVAEFLDKLALDASPELLAAAAGALGRIDPGATATRLGARCAAKRAAGLEIALELGLIGELPARIAAPALLEAAASLVDAQERIAFGLAAQRVRDARLVPALAAPAMLDPRQGQVRYHAVEALRLIDTGEAASALLPHLGEEVDLARKIQLAGFLGGHGFREGYPYAIEHMANAALRDGAVEALAAIRDPRTVPELRKIWETSHDAAWNAAAIRALGRLGQADLAGTMLGLAQDLEDPLAPSALIALGDLGDVRALPLARAAVGSRSDEITIAAARAAAKLLAAPGARDDDLRVRLAALLSDPNASGQVRSEALDALASLNDPRLGNALGVAARDARLEGNALLPVIEAHLAARKERLNLP
jgi:HEAT repeat protein